MKINGMSGFSLIELLVVITIINLLSSIIFAGTNEARRRARDLKRLAEIKQLQTALEIYNDKNGHYPVSLSCGATVPNANWCNSVETAMGDRWIKDSGSYALGGIIPHDPKDPKQGAAANWYPLNGGTYFYYSYGYPVPAGTGKSYMLVFGFEDTSHPFQAQDGVYACDGTYWHYGSGSNGLISLGGSCPR